MSTETLLKTPLHALHIELGARMVPFAGYDMPVQYPLGVMKEHLHTRDQAGLFDVSHMGQIRLTGANAAKALETLVPVDILDLPVGMQRYAMFTNDQGGILDDLMVANLGNEELFLVVNAACKDQDLAHLRQHIGDQCTIEPLFEERALLALQGQQCTLLEQRLDGALVADMLAQVRQVLVLAGGVDHQEQFFVTQVGHHQVIEDAALVVGEHRVALHADWQVEDVDRYQGFQGLGGIGAGEADLAHVGHVEQPGLITGVQVFLHHAQWVLHRHVVAGEGHHARAQLDVQGMQRGFQQGFGGHIQLLKNVLARR